MKHYQYLLPILFILASCSSSSISDEYRELNKDFEEWNDLSASMNDRKIREEKLNKRNKFIESLIGTEQEVNCYLDRGVYYFAEFEPGYYGQLSKQQQMENYPYWSFACREKTDGNRYWGSDYDIVISDVYVTKKERKYFESLAKGDEFNFIGITDHVHEKGNQGLNISFDNKVWNYKNSKAIHQKEKTIFFD